VPVTAESSLAASLMQGRALAGRSSAVAGTPGPPATDAAPDERRGTLLMLGLHEWILAVPRCGARPGAAALRGLARALASSGCDRSSSSHPGQVIVRLPGSLIGPDYAAALGYRNGRAAVYCSGDDLTRRAALVLSALLTRSGLLAPRPRDATLPHPVTVTPVPHESFPEPLHPAAAVADSGGTGFYVCSSLIASPLADAFAWLCRAQADLLVRSR
jgi:hypothetical protein